MKPLLLSAAVGLLLANAISPAAADCQCRARGVVANEGETLCIRAPGGFRLARCDKVSNITSWTFLDGACPQAGLAPESSPPTERVRLGDDQLDQS